MQAERHRAGDPLMVCCIQAILHIRLAAFNVCPFPTFSMGQSVDIVNRVEDQCAAGEFAARAAKSHLAKHSRYRVSERVVHRYQGWASQRFILPRIRFWLDPSCWQERKFRIRLFSISPSTSAAAVKIRSRSVSMLLVNLIKVCRKWARDHVGCLVACEHGGGSIPEKYVRLLVEDCDSFVH
jgi:hypothetical protein